MTLRLPRTATSGAVLVVCALAIGAWSAPALAATDDVATITYPADGAVYADLTQPIQWTAVADVQAYYLYVGTTPGAKDLVNTGERLQTSYLASGLPAGQVLYARMWTRAGGVWRYVDSTFTAASSASLTATITFPADGATDANLSLPIQWTTVADVQAYYLYVGTTPGAKDLVNTGETLQTSYSAAGLPAGQVLYARMWTRAGGVWRYVDSTFSAPAPLTAELIYPADGAVAIDQTQPATWSSVDDVQYYYLYVGSTPGAKDLIDSYGTLATSFPLAPLPAGPTLYARLWTQKGGVWRYRDSTFTASPIAPQFVYPTDGAVGVSATQPFSWTPPANAQAHKLIVGTAPGTHDLFDSGEITATSVSVAGLPPTGTLYARALSKVRGVWRHTGIAFTRDSSTPAPVMISPADGETGFDTVRPFEWQAVPLARGYRLRIGTTPGGDDLHDSGEIKVSRRFVPGLPLGTHFGRIETKLAGQWHVTDFTFSVGANTESAAVQIENALWATDLVRNMARIDNRPFTWTMLADWISERLAFQALCTDYAETLLRMLADMNTQLPTRRLDVALNPNHYDSHTLAEMYDPDTGRWLILDPTFGLTATRAADGSWATADDVSAATRAEQWGDITYEFTGALGDFYARSYYLDYPLLFVNIQAVDNSWGPPGPVLPYMEPTSMPVSGSHRVYTVGCAGEESATLLINGVESTVGCSGSDSLSNVFGASTIAPTDTTAPGVTVYWPRRYVF